MKTCALMKLRTGHTGHKTGASPVLLAMFHPFQHGADCCDPMALVFLVGGTALESTFCATGRNTMTASKKMGRPRDPAKMERVLSELSGEPAMFFEYGAPPYNVADLAQRLEIDPSNLRAYLLALERDGLVIRERRKVDTWNAIAGDSIPRRVLCFWNAATMEQDRAAADAWRAGADARSDEAMLTMFGRFVSQPSARQELSMVEVVR